MKNSTPTKIELKMEIKRLQSELDGFRCIGWITAEAYMRLGRGGNGSRGTVPIHPKPSCTAKIPIFRAPKSISDIERRK